MFFREIKTMSMFGNGKNDRKSHFLTKTPFWSLVLQGFQVTGLHATPIFDSFAKKKSSFNTASGKRVHATLCPGALVGQALKMGFWSRNVIFDRFCHFRTCAPVVFSKGNRLQPFPIKGFRHSRPNRSGFCESAKFSRFCTQFTDIYILPEFNRFFNPFHKKTAAQLSLRGSSTAQVLLDFCT